jgi:hypothetical protein
MEEICNELAKKSVTLSTKYFAKEAFEESTEAGAVAGGYSLL